MPQLDRYDLSTNGENVREDLENTLFMVEQTQTPTISSMGRVSVSNNYHEWLTDELDDPATNEHVDGADFVSEDFNVPRRWGNYCQISRKQIEVSRRAEIVNKAGRRSELARLRARKLLELRRDMEVIILSNRGAVVGNTTGPVAPVTAGIPAWLHTNSLRGPAGGATAGADATFSGGASPTYGHPTTGATDATNLRALTEAALFLTMHRTIWEGGGRPPIVQMGTEMKERFSEFTLSGTSRVASPSQDHGSGRGMSGMSGLTVIGAVEYYKTDFGMIKVVPNQWQRERDVYFLDPGKWKIGILDSLKTQNIAKIGDATRQMMIIDWCLICHNDKSSGVIADINSATAMLA